MKWNKCDLHNSYNPDVDLVMIVEHDDLPGQVTIYYNPLEEDDEGRPEVEYDSGLVVGDGSPGDIRLAIQVVRKALKEFTEKTGRSDFLIEVYCDDGFGERRERFFQKVFPEIEVRRYEPVKFGPIKV